MVHTNLKYFISVKIKIRLSSFSNGSLISFLDKRLDAWHSKIIHHHGNKHDRVGDLKSNVITNDIHEGICRSIAQNDTYRDHGKKSNEKKNDVKENGYKKSKKTIDRHRD